MTGQELKKILIDRGVNMTELADMLGMAQSQLSTTLRTQNIKTGLIESMCKEMKVKFDFFYDRKMLISENDDAYTGHTYSFVNDSKGTVSYFEKRVLTLEGKYNGLKIAFDKLLDKYTELKEDVEKKRKKDV